MSFAVIGVVFSLALAGCSDVFTEPFEYGTVEVSAERRTGDPVPEMDFLLFSGTRHLEWGVTDEEGLIVFRFVPHEPVGVLAHPADVYIPTDPETGYVTTFLMSEGDERRFTFTFFKVGPGSIMATVEDPEEEPIADVRLQLFSPQAPIEEGLTDGAGEHTFTDVPFGIYGVRVIGGPVQLPPGVGVFQDGLIAEADLVERVHFVLERCLGEVRALAYDETGDPLEDVPFTIYRPEVIVDEGSSGATGEHLFSELPCGEYGVSVGAVPGYELIDPPAGFLDGLLVERGSELSVEFTFSECCEE